MRIGLTALVAVVCLISAAPSGRAAPVAPGDIPAATAPHVLLVRGGCGPGWHPRRWVDRWGQWQVRCVPNRW